MIQKKAYDPQLLLISAHLMMIEYLISLFYHMESYKIGDDIGKSFKHELLIKIKKKDEQQIKLKTG